MSLKLILTALLVIISLGMCHPVDAGYKDDMGFMLLQSELGGSMPTGSGTTVSQVEAPTLSTGAYRPDRDNTQFTGKTLDDKTGTTPYASGHATTVGTLFYGNTSSLASGVTGIDCYDANHFLGSGSLHFGYSKQPGYTFLSSHKSSPSRVANHSWVGSTKLPDYDSDILRRLDFLVETDEFIQIVAPDNATSNKPLLISAFNSILVGRSDGTHQRGSVAVDSIYTAGRVKPDVVVPHSPTSYTAPLGASAAAILVQAGKGPALSTDPVQPYTTNRDGMQIRNAERSEVVKAALMAGASRRPRNAGVTDYRLNPDDQSPNGLDKRFGAGQVNVYHSYHIIAAGEQNSVEDYPAGQGNIGWYGFDFDPYFGGNAGSNSTASFYFTADENHRMLYASLVWNIDIHGGTWNNWNGTATLHNLDLFLQDVTDPQNPRLVAGSTGTGDNTENLWVPLAPARKYRLQVAGQGSFNWDFALAWRMTEPPDSDGDKLPDDWEVFYGMDYLNSAQGLGDSGVDTDSDGIPDDWEVYYGLSHLDRSDASLDPDDDELDNTGEYQYGTDPGNPDTDGDGFSDGYEVSGGYDPLDPGSKPPAYAVPSLGRTGILVCLVLLGVLGAATLPRMRKPEKDSPQRRGGR
ncbi:MAG: hypothetical protein JXL84_17930 [Deltaproteobacteria bacterium]|nr:hypothetical protein [Deltaproteobacteria bacterium]